MELQTVTIPYRFSPDEIVDLKNQLPDILTREDVVQEQKKEATKQFKEELAELKKQRTGIVKALRAGVEERTIQAEIIPDYGEKVMRFFVPGRKDPAHVRPMTTEERAIIPIDFNRNQRAAAQD